MNWDSDFEQIWVGANASPDFDEDALTGARLAPGSLLASGYSNFQSGVDSEGRIAMAQTVISSIELAGPSDACAGDWGSTFPLRAPARVYMSRCRAGGVGGWSLRVATTAHETRGRSDQRLSSYMCTLY